MSFDCYWLLSVTLSLFNFAHHVAGNECLGVFISADIEDTCYFWQWNISWTVESVQNASKQVTGTQNGVSCDLTFGDDDCLAITVQYQNYSSAYDPLTSIVFLYDSYQVFAFSPHTSSDWSTMYFYDYTLTINDRTNEMTIFYTECANYTDTDSSDEYFTTYEPTTGPTYECQDWPEYVCIFCICTVLFVFFFMSLCCFV